MVTILIFQMKNNNTIIFICVNRFLLDKITNINHRNKFGKTALEHHIECKNYKGAKLLIEYGAELPGEFDKNLEGSELPTFHQIENLNSLNKETRLKLNTKNYLCEKCNVAGSDIQKVYLNTDDLCFKCGEEKKYNGRIGMWAYFVLHGLLHVKTSFECF